MSLTDRSKSVSIVWEMYGPGLEFTRFVYNDHAGLDHSHVDSDLVFYGATSGNETAPKFDVLSGRLTTAKFDFHVVDKDQLITQWIARNDAALSKANIRRLVGTVGDTEDNYDETFWKLEDYGVGTTRGGTYKISAQDVLKQMSVSTYDDMGGKGELNADITAGATTITLEDAPSDSWPTVGGYGLLYDTGTRDCELFAYTGISGADLTGVTRGIFGVGGTGRAFYADRCEVYHVWVKRGNPIDVMLELLFSSAAKEERGAAATNGDLESWTGGEPDDWTSTSPGGGNTLTEETGDVHGGASAARLTWSGSGTSATLRQVFAASDMKLDHYLKVGIWAKRVAAGPLLQMNVQSSAGYSWNGSTWVSGLGQTVTYSLNETYGLKTKGVLMDSRYIHHDSTVTIIFKTASSSGAILLDDISMLGWYTQMTATSGDTYDVGDGVDVQGAGLPEHLVNLSDIETVRDAWWAQPTFDGSGNVTAGVGCLFVEKKSISDVKKFVEAHLLRPYGAKPLVDVQGRFTIGPYFDVASNVIEVGDRWSKSKFRASKWKRNYAKKINNIRMLSDWDPIKGEHEHAESKIQQTSVDRYGIAKALELPGRGGRTGLNGFPDYGSVDDFLDGIGRLFLETANPFTQIDVEVFYEFLGASLKDIVQINVPGIPNIVTGVRGLTNGSFFVDKKIIENKRGRVRMTLRQRRPVARPAFIAPNTHATTYSAASDPERETGCYIAPGGEENFSDNLPGYTIIGST